MKTKLYEISDAEIPEIKNELYEISFVFYRLFKEFPSGAFRGICKGLIYLSPNKDMANKTESVFNSHVSWFRRRVVGPYNLGYYWGHGKRGHAKRMTVIRALFIKYALLYIFIDVLERLLKESSHREYRGICSYIHTAGSIDHFVEEDIIRRATFALRTYTPLRIMKPGYYWNLDAFGNKKRIKLVRKIIAKIEKSSIRGIRRMYF